MTASQLMTAKSSAPADDFGACAPPLSVPHLGEPVKIQASELSDFLTSSPSNTQSKVDVSMEPAKLSLPWQTAPKPATPPAPETLPAPDFEKNWIPSQETIGAPPGVWQSTPETIATETMGAPPGMMLTPMERMNMAYAKQETWLAEAMQNYGFWPDPCQHQWWGQQAMHEAWTSNCFSDPSAMLPVPPPPAFNPTIEWAASPPADECARARYSSGESTELSGPGEFSRGFSTSDDEWSSGKDSGNNSPDGNFDGVKFGRMLLSLLNSETSDAPGRNPECEAEETCGAVSPEEADPMPKDVPAPPPGLPLPANCPTCVPTTLDMVAPPPGLTLPAPIEEPQSNSGSDADVSNAEAPESPCSPCTPPEASVPESFTCAPPKLAEGVTSHPAHQPTTARRAAEVFCPPPIQVPKKTELPIRGAVPAQRKVNKPKQQRVKAPAFAEVAPEPSLALQNKVADTAPAPEPEHAKPSSPKSKARVGPKHPPTILKTFSAAPVTEVAEASKDDFAMLDKQISVRSSFVPWFLVPWFLALLALVFTMAVLCCIGQWLDSGTAVEMDKSMAFEIQQSAMVTTGASYAWAATTVPALASAHVHSQTVASLAKQMDVEFARANAVASYLKSKLNEVRIALRAQRQDKERIRQFQEQFKAQLEHQQGPFQKGPFQQGPAQQVHFQFRQGVNFK